MSLVKNLQCKECYNLVEYRFQPVHGKEVNVPRILVLMLMCLALPGTVRAEGELLLMNGWARASTPGAVSAAVYGRFVNTSPTPLRLVSLGSDIAGRIMIHQSRLQGDMMKMEHVPTIEFPAGGEIRFEPGGYHLMVTGLKRPLRKGEVFTLAVNFALAGTSPSNPGLAPETGSSVAVIRVGAISQMSEPEF